jgi:ABC-type nitrate/sulfonate/bicarbonate transport system substrate-binding protein
MAYASLSLVLSLLFGTTFWSAAYALERIRIGLSVRNVVFLPFYYAQEKKIFEKHGLDAELIQIRTTCRSSG